MNRFMRSLAVLALGAGTVAVAATQAQAAPVCVVTSHTSADGIVTTTDGEKLAADKSNQSKATAVMVADGVEVTTPGASDKALWLQDAPAGTKLSSVTTLRYRVAQEVKDSTTLPSFQLVIDPEHGTPDPADPAAVKPIHFTTLVFEPGVNDFDALPVDVYKTFSLDPAGPLKWWSTKALPKVAAATTGVSLKNIIKAYPDATVTSYGWDLGKGNAGGDSVVNSLRFATTSSCALHQWAKYTGPATRKAPKIEGRSFDHGNVGWIKPFHSTFEAELVADYDNVAPAGTAERAAQVKALTDRNKSHTNGHGAPGQPLIFLPGTV